MRLHNHALTSYRIDPTMIENVPVFLNSKTTVASNMQNVPSQHGALEYHGAQNRQHRRYSGQGPKNVHEKRKISFWK